MLQQLDSNFNFNRSPSRRYDPDHVGSSSGAALFDWPALELELAHHHAYFLMVDNGKVGAGSKGAAVDLASDLCKFLMKRKSSSTSSGDETGETLTSVVTVLVGCTTRTLSPLRERLRRGEICVMDRANGGVVEDLVDYAVTRNEKRV